MGWKFLKAPFFGMAMMTDKILTIRPWSGLIDLTKLWRHPCRIVKVRDSLLVPITEGLHKSDLAMQGERLFSLREC